MSIYVIGSLANSQIPVVANRLRTEGFDVFSSWYCASENADTRWQEHEQGRGLTYIEALRDYAAQHVFAFDKHHLDRCDAAVLVYPAGRSGHLELGYAAGKEKKTYILLDKEPERWDVMLNFATGIHNNIDSLIKELHDTSTNLVRQEWNKDNWIRATAGECPAGCRCASHLRAVGHL